MIDRYQKSIFGTEYGTGINVIKMGKKEKLLERAKNSAKNYKFKDLIKLAEYHGFVYKRQKGSHVIMKHTDKSIFMNFQDKDGEAKPYQVKQLLEAIEEHDL